MRLAIRNLFRHPWRSLATLVGIGLGIAAVLTTLSVGDNVEANLRSALQAAAGKADLLVTPGPGGRAVFEIEPLTSEIARLEGVVAVEPVLMTRAEPARAGGPLERGGVIPGIDSGFQVAGRRTQNVDTLPLALSAGSLPTSGSNAIAVADGFADLRGIQVGQVVEFRFSTGTVDLVISGLLDDGVGYASTNGGRIGVMHLDDLATILRLEGRTSNLEIEVVDAATVPLIQYAAAELAGDDFAVTFPAGSGNFASGIVQTLQSGLSVLAATLLALGAFLAYNTFMSSVVERRREYALLRTICMARTDVRRMALYEALALAVAGVVMGILLGILLSYLMTRLNAAALGFEFRTLVVPLRSVLMASALGVVASVLAGTLPANSAARTPPMRAAQTPDGGLSPWQLPVGLLLLVIGAAAALYPWHGQAALIGVAGSLGLFFVGVSLASPALLVPTVRALRPLMVRLFGAAGRLGVSFAQRNAARNGVAIGTVVVGVGLVIGVGSMVESVNRAVASWVDTTVIGDLYVTTPVGFPPGFGVAAERVEGIAIASGVGIKVVRYLDDPEGRGRSVALVLAEADRFDPQVGFGRFQYLPGQGDDASGYQALLRPDAVLVANTIRDRYGVEMGDTIALRTVDGFRDFEVAGVVVDFTAGGETIVTGLGNIDAFGGGTPELYVMTVDNGVAPSVARERLLAAFPELGLDATLNLDYRRYILDVSSQAFGTTRLLLVIAVLVATLGVANTLGMNLVNRSHEIAVLRTLGLSRAGVRWLIAAEGVIVMLLGAAIGAVFGFLLARVVTTTAGGLTGFMLEPVIPWSVAVLALLAAPIAGLLASILPARRAAKLAPSRALATWSDNA